MSALAGRRGACDSIVVAAQLGQWGLLKVNGEVAAQLFGVVELDAFEAYAVGGRYVVWVVVLKAHRFRAAESIQFCLGKRF